jgi:hypothetical protein
LAVVNTAHELDVLIMFLELNATINNTADRAGIYIDVDDVTPPVESVIDLGKHNIRNRLYQVCLV